MMKPLRRWLAAAALPLLLTTPAAAQSADDAPSATEQRRFVRDRLTEAVLLMDRHFRVPETGQYLDAITIGAAEQSPRIPSSIAATGIGLVSLALGDALGVIDDAEEKAAVTLRNLLNLDKESGFEIARSRRGWYPHFVDARTGEPKNGSQGKVSTIDTALLAAGTAIAARYFNAKSYVAGEGESRVFRLSGRLVGGVRWRSAIKDVERGLVHLVFKGEEETELTNIFANPFDEYAILPCMAMRGEQMAGVSGPAHELFFRHYGKAENLPMREYEGVTVISKPNGRFIAHFTHLFAYYYCNNFMNQGAFRKELRQLSQADRRHFVVEGEGEFPPYLWGLGAGAEVKFHEDGPKKGEVERSGYGVNNLTKNPHNTASPAVMAGFAPLFRYGQTGDPVPDLMQLWTRRTCRYEHQRLEFLWRCSARDTSKQVRRVEAVDFSTYLLGLAGRDAKFGMAFFRNFNL